MIINSFMERQKKIIYICKIFEFILTLINIWIINDLFCYFDKIQSIFCSDLLAINRNVKYILYNIGLFNIINNLEYQNEENEQFQQHRKIRIIIVIH